MKELKVLLIHKRLSSITTGINLVENCTFSIFQSANIETYPQDAVSRVQMSSYDKNSPFYEIEMKDLHPFGKLSLKLVKTYHRDCDESAGESSFKLFLVQELNTYLCCENRWIVFKLLFLISLLLIICKNK